MGPAGQGRWSHVDRVPFIAPSPQLALTSPSDLLAAPLHPQLCQLIMEKFLVLLLIALAVAYAVPDPRGIIINLEDGELCLNSAQCKSQCCHRSSGLSLARCMPKASENNECSAKTLYGVYYKCPCERGLTCDVDKTIVGSITNTNFGICYDVGRSKE
ncbi:colipase [Choloepus didactylus]|uniref:colipase n=1 Tax=Choloepus didactylus TaxID=27675 RepID=UPI00189CD491|nr:colipase [Choloepus didactylus]